MGPGRHSRQTERRPARAAVIAVVAVAVVAAGVVVGVRASAGGAPSADDPAARSVPYQFVTKAYTELLGRAPTPGEWSAGTAFFEDHRCGAGSLRQFGTSVVGSAEYRRDYPAGQAAPVALTLYRFVLNREPTAAEFVALRDRLAAGASAVTGADALFATSEFATRTEPAICSPASPGYSFGEPGDLTGHPAVPTPTTGTPGADASGAALQKVLDTVAASGGGTVTLPARQVTGLATTLDVPAGVTLTTDGDPDPGRYAQMARLVRLPSFAARPGAASSELVRLEPGARLVHVWVDGQRYGPDPSSFLTFDVRMAGGVGTTVQDDRIGNTFGASSLEDDASTPAADDPTGCRDNVVADNLVEGYATAHTPPSGNVEGDHTQADGIGIICGSTRVEGNDVVDVSDAAIVLFDADDGVSPVPPQLSVVADNTIVSAGNSAYYAIVTDPLSSLGTGGAPGGDPAGVTSRAFAAAGSTAVIEDNRIWTGARTHFDTVLASGTHLLFGSTAHQDCDLPDAAGHATCGGGRNATGARWVDNTSAGLPSRAQMGIYVGGTDDATFTGNRFPDLGHVTGGNCPRGAVVVASGTGPATDFARGLHIDTPVTRDTRLRSDLCVTPAF